MKVKNIFIILVVDIFLMMLVTIYQEYADIHDTLESVSKTFNLAVDSSISMSMASEEFFSDEFDDALASKSNSYRDSDRYLYSTVKVMRNGDWIGGNLYIMSMYYNEYGDFPSSQWEYDTYADGRDITDVYKFVFGETGSDYDSPDLSWANSWQDGYVIDASRRTPNADFKAFYDSVGNQIKSNQYVKVRTVDNTWSLEEQELPVLCQMGLKLDDYNKATSDITSDNFTSVEHSGRLKDDEILHLGSDDNTIYYLTPYSLGVTYVPPVVFKTNMRANLENLIRFNKCKMSPTSNTVIDMNLAYASAEGCIDTSVYDDGMGGASLNSVDHSIGLGEDIFNDGRVEYDLSTLQIKVDYFVVDFYDNANWEVVNEIMGATPYNKDLMQTLPQRLAETDTGVSSNGNRIVARVTAKVKLHVPYKSAIMQWFIRNTSGSGVEHYDIAGWNTDTSSIDSTADGIWYTYTTYTAISR